MINSWLLFIIAIILVSFFLELLVSILNLKHSPKLPAEFEDIYDHDSYSKSQQYTRETTRFSLVENSISTLVTLVFLLAGGFNLVDIYARSFGFGEITTGLIFTGLLLLLSFLVGMPFSIYSTFVIEERFGFNRTTIKTFTLDIAKAVLLTILIGGPVLALILWFFLFMGSLAWLYCWIGVFILTLLLQFLAPVLIMPLFNKFTPLEEGELKQAILQYTAKEKFTIKGVFVMDGSKRSTKLNAFFTGFGRFKKIVFFDTLMEKLSTQQVLGVLAHEMGHYKHRHLLKMIVASFFQTGILFFFLSLIMENENLFAAFSMDHISTYAGLVFFGFLYSPVSLLLAVIFNHISRKHEYQADEYAALSTGSPQYLIESLKILSQTNLSNLTPHPLNVFLHYSHPPVVERIRALRSVAI
ncbi:MAG: M48 family metallopeptidase [Desulfopila sp.]|jgi:STE24 endopeptidase|nr:M48 family metallopeptidase [Desulfopila sp.]